MKPSDVVTKILENVSNEIFTNNNTKDIKIFDDDILEKEDLSYSSLTLK